MEIKPTATFSWLGADQRGCAPGKRGGSRCSKSFPPVLGDLYGTGCAWPACNRFLLSVTRTGRLGSGKQYPYRRRSFTGQARPHSSLKESVDDSQGIRHVGDPVRAGRHEPQCLGGKRVPSPLSSACLLPTGVQCGRPVARRAAAVAAQPHRPITVPRRPRCRVLPRPQLRRPPNAQRLSLQSKRFRITAHEQRGKKSRFVIFPRGISRTVLLAARVDREAIEPRGGGKDKRHTAPWPRRHSAPARSCWSADRPATPAPRP